MLSMSSTGFLEDTASGQVSHCEISKHSRLRTSLSISILLEKGTNCKLLNKNSNVTFKLIANCASHNQDTLFMLTQLHQPFIFPSSLRFCIKCHNLMYQLQSTHFTHSLSTLILLNGLRSLAAG